MSKKKIIALVVAIMFIILWVLLIYKLSAMTTTNSNGKSTDIIAVFIEDTLEITNKAGITKSHPTDAKLERASGLLNAPLRKVMHASVYFVLAFMIMFAVSFIFKHQKYLVPMTISLVLIILFASFDEFHQTFVDGRTGQIKDVIIDTMGGIVGLLFYGTYYYVYKRGYKKALNIKKEVV